MKISTNGASLDSKLPLPLIVFWFPKCVVMGLATVPLVLEALVAESKRSSRVALIVGYHNGGGEM